MTTTMRLLPVRVSAKLRALIDQVGPVNPATRALLVLGADAAGLELGGLEREIAGLLAADLDVAVRAALRDLLARVPARQAAAETRHKEEMLVIAPPLDELPDDPFTSVGIAV